MRPIRSLTLSGLTAVVLVATVTPAIAVDVPAYGVITITNEGLGANVSWTYDGAFWACETALVGQFNAPTAVTVTCDALSEGPSIFVCPLMVLTVQTKGLVARAGGRASCTGSLDTGIVSGVNTAQRTGNLGRAESIVCGAYGGSIPLVPPYTVTCSEPGLPVLAP